MWRLWLGALLISGCASAPVGGVAAAADQMGLDMAAYAEASCLAAQKQTYLRDQGERWAGAVIQRGAGPIETWKAIGDAVDKELARSGIAQGQGDGPAAPTVPLPIMTCGEIANMPSVRAEIARAATVLSPAYRAKTE